MPVVESPPLARALHATVEIDCELPAKHDQAVAEVIGCVLKLNQATAGRGGKPQELQQIWLRRHAPGPAGTPNNVLRTRHGIG